MKTAQHHPHHHQKQPPKQIKPPNRSPSIFSCTFFRHCTDSPLSPTLPQPSPPPPPPPPPLPPLPPPTSRQLCSLPPPHHPTKPSDSESSSSSTSQSFTQWRFPPTFPHPPLDPSQPPPPSLPPPPPTPPPPPPIPLPPSDLRELFHVAELKFTAGSDSERLSALHMMERSLVPNPPSDAASGGGDGGGGGGAVVVPAVVMSGVVGYMKEKAVAKSATKILLALCLSEGNRRVAVECGAAARVVDALPDMEGTVAERALAALELMCTMPEGAAEVRAHALAVPMLVAVMGRMEGRGREYAIGVLAAFYGNGADHEMVAAAAPPEEVGRAVVLAMQQGDCSARGKRKGAQLLKALQEHGGLDLTQEA